MLNATGVARQCGPDRRICLEWTQWVLLRHVEDPTISTRRCRVSFGAGSSYLYIVTVTDDNGCTATEEVSITINADTDTIAASFSSNSL